MKVADKRRRAALQELRTPRPLADAPGYYADLLQRCDSTQQTTLVEILHGPRNFGVKVSRGDIALSVSSWTTYEAACSCADGFVRALQLDGYKVTLTKEKP